MTVALQEITRLSVAERIQLVEDIWDSIATQADGVSLTEAQMRDLDQRLNDLDANPSAGSPWHEVRQRIMGK